MIGLEGLTLGVLAAELGLSKSGLYAHFGSKEELQLDTLARAREIGIQESVRPALRHPRGLTRLWALCTGFLSYLDREVFPGGCFVAGAVAEWDARTGPVHDAVAQMMDDWTALFVRAARGAVDAGHLEPTVDPEQLAFEICALLQGTNFQFQLHRDRQKLVRAARAIERLLQPVTSDSAPGLEPWHVVPTSQGTPSRKGSEAARVS